MEQFAAFNDGIDMFAGLHPLQCGAHEGLLGLPSLRRLVQVKMLQIVCRNALAVLFAIMTPKLVIHIDPEFSVAPQQ